MPAMRGEEGDRGNPTFIQNLDLAKFGVHGNGTIQVKANDEMLSELIWESRPDESTRLDSVIEQDHEIPKAISEWCRIRSAGKSDASEEAQVRLTGPVKFVVKLLAFWDLEPLDAVGLLGFDVVDADHVSAVLDGRELFRGRDVRDRIAHLFSIRATLWALFRDLTVENDWLREPHALLGGQTPLSLLLGGSMEDLLLVREYVDDAAGKAQDR